MRIVLCDDDEPILHMLQKYLQEYFRLNHLNQPEYAVYTCGDDLLEHETNGSIDRVDIAFIDVEMPGRDGIHTGAKLKEIYPNARIFIVTSYLDYLDDAMRFHVFRYLSKPIDKHRLFRNMKDALYQIATDTRQITIETKDKTIVCSADEIIMVETLDRKLIVHTISGTYESVQSFRHWNSLLKDACFNRPHRSYIINFKYITSYTRDVIHLKASSGQECTAYIARRQYQNFKEAHLIYLEAMS